MAVPTSRPVRLPRAPPAETPGPEGPAPEFGNRSGLRRARRLLLMYLVAEFLVFAAVLGLFVTSPYETIRADVPAYAVLIAVAAISAIGGYLLTVGRAPWSFGPEDGHLVIRERFGAIRRHPIDAQLRVRVVLRSSGGWLSPEPTETVRVAYGREKVREYVLGAGSASDRPELVGSIDLR